MGNRRGASNEYPQHVFIENTKCKKNISNFRLKKGALTGAMHVVSGYFYHRDISGLLYTSAVIHYSSMT